MTGQRASWWQSMVRRQSAIRIGLAVLTVVLVGAVFGQEMSKVSNTPHNLNTLDVWGVIIPENRVCLPCHTPHNAQTQADGSSMVLWNHALTSASFDMYTTQAGHTGLGPDGASKMCLSCHDGVTAVDSYGGNDGYFIDKKIPSWRPTYIGTDLRDDHPIGVQYPPPDLSGYKDKSTFTGVRVVNINGQDRVECTSCHDPHNNSLGDFLRTPMAGSQLCLECHDK